MNVRPTLLQYDLYRIPSEHKITPALRRWSSDWADDLSS